MRVAVFGSGGVGGYFGGRLAAVGEEVVFIARGAHLAALNRGGLRVISPKGDLHLPRVRATDDPATVGPSDVVLFTVKMYDVEAAAGQLGPLVGPDTVVITLQNGVEAVDMVTRHLGREHVAGGAAYVSAVIDAPGVVRHTALDSLAVGELDGRTSDRLLVLQEAARRAGFLATVSSAIAIDLWTKFIWLSALSGVLAVARAPMGVVRADAGLFAMLVRAVEEGLAVGRARDVQLPEALLDDTRKMAMSVPAHTKSSMLEDLERSRPLELPWLNGAMVRLGREAGVPTPTHELIATVLNPFVNGTVPMT